MEIIQSIDRKLHNLCSKLGYNNSVEHHSTDYHPLSNVCSDVEENVFINDMKSEVDVELHKPKLELEIEMHVSNIDIEDEHNSVPDTILESSESTNDDYVPKMKKKHNNRSLKKHKSKATSELVKKEPNYLSDSDEPLAKSLKTKRKCKENTSKNMNSKKAVRRTSNKNTYSPKFDASFFKDYVMVVVLTPEDAKKEVLLRKESNNYKVSPHKCGLCFRGFEFKTTFDNHMKKHSPVS